MLKNHNGGASVSEREKIAAQVADELSATYGRSVLTKKQLAKYLGVHCATLDRQIAAGSGVAYYKRGVSKRARVFYRVADIADYVSQSRIQMR